MKITIHADPGEAGMATAERVKRKIESRVAQADGIVEVVQASEPSAPKIMMHDITKAEPYEFGSDEESE